MADRAIDLTLLGRERVRPLERAWYDRRVELGAFQDERLELLEGRIIMMSPQGTAHARAVRRLTMRLAPALAGRAEVLVQLPLAVSDLSEPEPDLCVVPPGEYLEDHPCQAWLVVEVADSSLDLDRLKARLYAAAGVPEYWIVNLRERVVEVHREPRDTAYATVTRRDDREILTLLEFADVTVPVADLVPPR
ncbi:MAG TPA: Uma2 family endonuclease [Polyangia bacterium]